MRLQHSDLAGSFEDSTVIRLHHLEFPLNFVGHWLVSLVCTLKQFWECTLN